MPINYKNRPPHIKSDNTIYFITARTINGIRLFDSDDKKKLLRDVLFEAIRRFNFNLHTWVVLDNHYHALMEIIDGNKLPDIVRNINANSARLLNREDDQRGRKIWWNYWDHCIRDEQDYYAHINYIHQNPVKHKLVKRLDEYEFSSYKEFLEKYGQEWLDDCFYRYPVIDFLKYAE